MVGALSFQAETAATASGAPKPFFSRTVIRRTTASPLSLLGFMQLKLALMSEVLKLQLHTLLMTSATIWLKVSIFEPVLTFWRRDKGRGVSIVEYTKALFVCVTMQQLQVH